jgi:hypothetical protein
VNTLWAESKGAWPVSDVRGTMLGGAAIISPLPRSTYDQKQDSFQDFYLVTFSSS